MVTYSLHSTWTMPFKTLVSLCSDLIRPVFPPLVMVGPLLRFLESFHRSCAIVVLDVYPRKYWWPILQRRSSRSCKIALKGGYLSPPVPFEAGAGASSGHPRRPLGFPHCFLTRSVLYGSILFSISNCYLSYLSTYLYRFIYSE